MKVLVTGATGFVGANLVRALVQRGDDVFVVVRPESNRWRLSDVASKLTFVTCDLLDAKAVERVLDETKPEIIFHCAVYGGFPEEKDLDRICATNITSTILLFNAAAKRNVKFINISSSSEYGLKEHPMKEDDALAPTTDYGVSKATATRYVSLMAKKDGTPAITLRLFSPFGYYESKNRLFPSILLNIVRGQDITIGDPSSARDFIFIADAVDGILTLAERCAEYPGEVFNIGTGTQRTVGEIAELALKASGKDLKIVSGNSTTRAYDARTWVADMDKTFSRVEWRPETPIEEHIAELLRWFEENESLYP